MFKLVDPPLPATLDAWAVEFWNVAFLPREGSRLDVLIILVTRAIRLPLRHRLARLKRRVGWWDLASPPPWRHVVAYGYAARAERWVFFDPAALGRAALFCEDREFGALYTSLVGPEPTAILSLPRGPLSRMRLQACTTCAGAVSHAIGWRSRALRPLALYRELLGDPETEVVVHAQAEDHGPAAADHASGGRPGGEVAA